VVVSSAAGVAGPSGASAFSHGADKLAGAHEPRPVAGVLALFPARMAAGQRNSDGEQVAAEFRNSVQVMTREQWRPWH
jgi:hypothetical protein